MRSAAMVRLLMFAGGGRKELYWFGLTTRSDAARVRDYMVALAAFAYFIGRDRGRADRPAP